MYRGQERVVQAGSDGQLIKTLQLTYHDNQVVQETVINSEVVAEAVDRVVEYGTISSISRGGYRIGISRVLDVRATAYCAGTEGSDAPGCFRLFAVHGQAQQWIYIHRAAGKTG